MALNRIITFIAALTIAFGAFATTASATTCPVFSGCTGTSTLPAYGKVLVGGKDGEYEYVASSTFGGGGGVTSVFGRNGVVTVQSGDYTTSLVTEGSNLYFTNVRALAALGTGANGQVFAWLNGVPTWTATTTLTNGTSITTAYSGGQWTITNTGITSNAGDWAGTWQTFAPSHFQVAGSYIGDPFTHTSYSGQSVSATSTGIWLSGSPLSVIASSSFATYSSTTALTNSGPTWMTALAAGGLAVDANHKLYTGATSTLSTILGQLDLTSQVTGDLPFSNLAQVSANSVLGNISGATADASSISTSSLFAATNGQVLARLSGAWTGVATTTLTNGAGITTAFNAGVWTVTNTGVISNSCPGGFLTCSGTNPSSFTLGTLGIANGGTGSTTAPAGQVIYGGATAYQSVATGTVSAGTGISVTGGQSIIGSGLTITNTGVTSNAGDWAGTWQTFSPSHFQIAGNYLTAYDAFTHPAAGQSATSSLLQFFGQASTSELTATSTVWLTSLGTPAGTILAVDPTGKIIATSTSAGGVTAVSATYPIASTGGSAPTISTAFGTTSTWGIGNDLFIYTSHTGIPLGVASSSLSLPNAALQNSSLTVTANSPLTGGGSASLGGSTSLGCQTASGSQAGCIAAVDWSHFNSATTTFTAPLVYTLSTNAVTLTTSGTWSGNAGTATALAANGTNCSAGNYPLGVDASGNAENCTLAATGIVDPFSHLSTFNTTTSATSSSIWTQGAFFASSTVAASQFPYASTTAITAATASTTNLIVSGIHSALFSAGADGTASAYGGASACGSNNFVTTISAVGATTCGTASISGVNLGSNLNSLSHGSTITGTSYNGSAAVSNWDIDLTHANTWTGLQQFNGGASSTGEISAVTASSTNLIVSSAGGTGTRCLQVSATGVVSSAAAACGTGGSTTPGGSDKSVQFNDGGSTFGGNSNFTYNKANDEFTVGGGNTNSGDTSIVLGENSTASGDYSGALGLHNTATNLFAWSIGHDNQNAGEWGSAIGDANFIPAAGEFGTAIGASSTASAIWATAIGASTTASGAGSLALGASTTASGPWSMAFGQLSTSTGSWSFAGGQQSKASGDWSFAYGQNALAATPYSFAAGHNALVSGAGVAGTGGSVAIGAASGVTDAYDAIAGPNASVIDADYSVAFGNLASARGRSGVGDQKNTAIGDHAIAGSQTTGGNLILSIGANVTNTFTSSVAVGSYLTNTQGSAVGVGYDNSKILQHTTNDLAFGYQAQSPTLYILPPINSDTAGLGNGAVSIGDPTATSLFTVNLGSHDDFTTTIFKIASSTASATTTLFSIDNIGTTTLGRFGACNTTNALTTDSSGHIVCGAITGSGGGGIGDPFTHPAAGQSATTSLVLLNGNASTTRLSVGTSATTTITSAGWLGIASTSPMAALSVMGTTTLYSNTFHTGTVPCLGGIYAGGLQGGEICGNDNNTNRGVQLWTENTNRGANAWVGVDMGNDRSDASVLHYAGMFYNSSVYTDTSFGGAVAIPNEFQFQNSDGRVSFIASTSTREGFFNWMTQGTASTSEKMRLTGTGQLSIGSSTYSTLGLLTVQASSTFNGNNSMLFVVASTTAAGVNSTLFSIDNTGLVTAPGSIDFSSASFLKIPQSVNPTIDATGKFAINTTAASSSLRYYDGTAERSVFPDGIAGLPFASSSLAYMGAYGASGTTTIKQLRTYRPLTLMGFYCDTDVGTAFVQIGNGTASSSVQCTTSGPFVSSSVTWTMGQVMYIAIGTIASAPNVITVSPDIRKDAD